MDPIAKTNSNPTDTSTQWGGLPPLGGGPVAAVAAAPLTAKEEPQLASAGSATQSVASSSGDKIQILKLLGDIGRALHNTYSEVNQDTAEGFVQARNEIESLRGLIEGKVGSELTVTDKDGLLCLLTYLDKKLERRVQNSDSSMGSY